MNDVLTLYLIIGEALILIVYITLPADKFPTRHSAWMGGHLIDPQTHYKMAIATVIAWPIFLGMLVAAIAVNGREDGPRSPGD